MQTVPRRHGAGYSNVSVPEIVMNAQLIRVGWDQSTRIAKTNCASSFAYEYFRQSDRCQWPSGVADISSEAVFKASCLCAGSGNSTKVLETPERAPTIRSRLTLYYLIDIARFEQRIDQLALFQAIRPENTNVSNTFISSGAHTVSVLHMKS